MRNFDNWNRYLDNDNKPLHGCVMFNVKDGNTVAPIFDSDGTALDNPILTDEYGRTQHQVFINVDVVAYFYKYIGTGRYNTQLDIDVSDDSLWSLQYTSENINDILAHITSDTVVCISNIAELRSLDIDTVPTVDGEKVITLLGYNEVGDKEPINYIWDATSQDNDDNGSVIQGPLLTGRWNMVKPTEHCDSRHFGIFPSNSLNNPPNTTARIQQLVTYCNSACLRPYFSADGDYKYYKYSNLSLTTSYVDVAKSVTFIDIGTSNIWYTEFNGNPYFYNHSTTLGSKFVKTSWGAGVLIQPEHVVIDNDSLTFQTAYANCIVDINAPLTKECSFTDCTVNCNASVGSICTFTRCIINSKNRISTGSYFVNCKLTEDMFYGTPFIHVDSNCIADFNDFEHKQLMWLRIKDQQAQVNYDWEGVLTTQNPWENVVDSDRWLLNYKSTNANAVLKESDNPHTYYIENCAGSLTLQGKAANNYIIKDSELVLKFANGYNQGCTIRFQDSTVNISQDRIRLANLNSQNSSLTGTGSFDANNAFMYNTVQNVPVYCGYCDVKDSNIGDTLQIYGVYHDDVITVDPTPEVTSTHATYDVHTIISGNVVNNFISGQLEIGTIDSQDPHLSLTDLVRGLTIMNNVGMAVEPVKVNRSISSIYDNYNIYVYKGNTGSMEMKSNVIHGTVRVSGYTDAPGVLAEMSTSNGPIIGALCVNTSTYFAEIPLFTIGTQNVRVRLMGEVVGNSDNNVNSFGPGGVFSSNWTNTLSSIPKASIAQDIEKSTTSQFSWKLHNFMFGFGNNNNGDYVDVQFTHV